MRRRTSFVETRATAITTTGADKPGRESAPLLIISNGAYYFIVPGEIYYDVAHSKDKTYAISEGAVHAGTPCADCTRVILNNPDLPTAEANAYWTDPQGNGPLERSFNFMAEWLSARY